MDCILAVVEGCERPERWKGGEFHMCAESKVLKSFKVFSCFRYQIRLLRSLGGQLIAKLVLHFKKCALIQRRSRCQISQGSATCKGQAVVLHFRAHSNQHMTGEEKVLPPEWLSRCPLRRSNFVSRLEDFLPRIAA